MSDSEEPSNTGKYICNISKPPVDFVENDCPKIEKCFYSHYNSESENEKSKVERCFHSHYNSESENEKSKVERCFHSHYNSEGENEKSTCYSDHTSSDFEDDECGRKFRNKFREKNSLDKECDSSNKNDFSDNDSNSESEPEKLIFMAMNSTKAPESIISKDEGDLTKQLTNYQDELERISLKCKTLKEENKYLIRERRNFELQLEVSRRDNERLLQQLQERERVIERLQAEIISERQLNKATQQLNEMISNQRPPSDKIGLGYEKHQENIDSSSQHHEKKGKEPQLIPLSNQSILGPPPLLHQLVEQSPRQHRRSQPPLQRHEQPSSQHQRYQPPRRNTFPNFAPRYNFKFNGHCFYCGIFGHRIANCFKKKNAELRFSRMKFESLSSEIEYPKCSNFGHTTNNCRPDIQRSYQTNWVRQGSQSHPERYECNLAIQKVERDKIPWYVDSGCFKHLQT